MVSSVDRSHGTQDPALNGHVPVQSQATSLSSKAAVTLTSCIRTEVSEMCTKKFVQRRLPIITWLPQYSLSTLGQDMLAGLTVALTLIPQSMAYADVAGLPPQYGLYSSFMGCFVYILLGTCKDMTIGPTAIMGILTNPFVVRDDNPDFAILLCFVVGCITVLLGLLRLGFLVEFISFPVTAGFISAAAVTIGSTQLKNLLGIKGGGNEFLEAWKNFFNNVQHTRAGDVTLGVCTILLLLIGRKLNDFSGDHEGSSAVRRFLGKTMWIISISRNSIVVIIAMILAYVLQSNGYEPFTLTGEVQDGLPPFGLPPFSIVSRNETLNFEDMISVYGTSLLSIPMLSILETVSLAKSFSKGKTLDATQEFFALGMCNILGSFVCSFPTAGSVSRSAVNRASGVKTPLGGLLTGALVLMALGFLIPTFAYIPKATLAAVIICAVIFMVEYEMVPLLWRTKKMDLIPMAVTFIACLGIGLDYGMLMGIGVNLMFILYNAARPKVRVRNMTIETQDVLLVTPEQGLVFPAAEYIRDVVFNHSVTTEDGVVVVVEGTNVYNVDSTVAKNMTMLVDDIEIKKQKIIFWNWKHSIQVACQGIDARMSKYFSYEENLECLLQGITAESTGDNTNGTQNTSSGTEPNV